MPIDTQTRNRRVLIVDDSAAIHDDFKKILVRSNPAENDLEKAEAALFDSPTMEAGLDQDFELSHAYQGEDAMVAVCEAVKTGCPFALAFVDIRMPPGLDGIETTEQLWKADPDLQIIICSAYSDYSWNDIHRRLGATDRMVILKKPFDAIEVLQLASALTEKWTLLQQARLKMSDLEQAIGERTQELQNSNKYLRDEVRQRQTAEQKLQGAQAKLKHFLAKSPAVLYSLKIENGNLVPSWISDNFTNFSGLEVGEWYRRTPEWDYVEPADRPALSESLQRLLVQNNQSSLQFRIRRSDETVRWVRDDRQLVRDGSAQPVEIVGCWTDITETKQLEDHLRQSQKMEAFGQLAGGVAHDFNNLLTIIQGYVCMLQDRDLPFAERASSVTAIGRAAERAAQLTRQLLAFTRRQLFQTRSLDLNEVISSTGPMLQKMVGESITLETCFMAGRAGILADQHMVEQVLINLAANARDAMPKGGRLVLSTSLREATPTHNGQNEDPPPGPYACLSVSDTGSGISPENLTKIFEPFFTTKEVGKGTGLGLASVYGIVKQHGGWIETESSVGQGTTFRIYFPATSLQPAPAPAKPVMNGKPVRGGEETILVVEDEPSLRELFRDTLQSHGYRVFTESSGVKALDAWSSRLDQVDLLLTDIVMPGGVSGWELVHSLSAAKPGLKAICMSGHSPESNARTGHIPLLTKPFDSETLAEAVRARLDGAEVTGNNGDNGAPVLQA